VEVLMRKSIFIFGKNLLFPLALMLFGPISAFAGTGMTIAPVDTTIQKVAQDLTGFWAYTLVTIAIVVAGVMLAMGEGGGPIKKLGGVIMGGAIALGATENVSTLYTPTGALLG
jgi:type IV secretory pathway VirB2 component (pilin)